MISQTVLSRVMAIVSQVASETGGGIVTGDALLSTDLSIGPLDRVRIANALDREFSAKVPQHAVDGWLIVADIARSVERYA
jgi:acyl carrier protein